MPLSFLEDLGHGGCLILDFQVELALLREDEELLHHLVKHLHLLYVGEGVRVLPKEVLRAHLGGDGHLLTSLSVEENFHVDEGALVVEGDQTLMLPLFLMLEDTPHSEQVSVEQLSSLVFLQKDSRWQREWVWLISRNSRDLKGLKRRDLLSLFDLARPLNMRHLEEIARLPHFKLPLEWLPYACHLVLHLSYVRVQYLLAGDTQSESEVKHEVPEFLMLLPIGKEPLYACSTGQFRELVVAFPQDKEFLTRWHLQVVDLDEEAAIVGESLEGHNQHVWDLVGVEELQALCVEDVAVRWFLRANHRVVLEDHLAPLFGDDLLEADQAYSRLEALINLDFHL